MRIGISLCSNYFVSDPREGARNMIERAVASRDAGLDSLFVGDHHSVPIPYYQNVPILGRLLAEWRKGPAGALFLLPLWNPVLVAEQIGTLAAIAPDRFIMQCALGGGDGQFAAMGANMRLRPSEFEEGLDIVRRLCAGETVSGTKRYEARDARIAPVPAEPLEVWIGAAAPPAIDRAARLGDAWLAGPELTFEHARKLLDAYRDRCEHHRREPTAVPIRRDVYVGESDAEAEATTREIVGKGYRGFDLDALVIGGVERVASRFRELASMGYTDVIVRNLMPDQPAALGSIARLALVRELLNAS